MGTPMFCLDNKIIVVTGGLGLIGKETCKVLVNQGAQVIIADKDDNKEKISGFEKELNHTGSNAVCKQLNIMDEEMIINFIDEIEDQYGEIYGWVNLAYPRTADWSNKFENIKLESWRENVDLQLNSHFLCCQKILEKMKLRNKGAVVNFASIYGLNGPNFNIYEGTEMTLPAAYSAIKGGVVNFTKYLAAYYGKNNLRINAVAPGGIFDNQNPIFVNNFNKLTPMARMGQPKDIAPVVAFLLSEEAGYITGQTIVVDGGFSIW